MAHVNETKKATVKEFVDLIEQYPIVGAVNMENLPSKTMQSMRESMRGNVLIKMSKRRLLKIALEQSSKKGILELGEHLKGMPALLFTKENPFTLYKNLQKNKSTAPAKAGQIAPKDIIVPAGPTGFAPGPVIGELGGLGIKAGIEGGKVAIKADAVVAKEGDVIKPKVAEILTRLGIEPMEIGLDITAVYEDGEIYNRSILAVDEQEYIDNITAVAGWAFNLAVNSVYMCAETSDVIISSAFSQAKALSVSTAFVTEDTANDIIGLANSQMMSVASLLPDEAKSEDLKGATVVVQSAAAEAPKEEPKEDKPEEPKADAASGLGALFG